MPCRAIHSLAGDITAQPYGKPGEAIYSASRSLLNRALLDACDALPNVRTYFESTLRKLESSGAVTVEHAGSVRTFTPALVIGADGAYSAVRYLHALGFEPFECASEDEARGRASDGPMRGPSAPASG